MIVVDTAQRYPVDIIHVLVIRTYDEYRAHNLRLDIDIYPLRSSCWTVIHVDSHHVRRNWETGCIALRWRLSLIWSGHISKSCRHTSECIIHCKCTVSFYICRDFDSDSFLKSSITYSNVPCLHVTASFPSFFFRSSSTYLDLHRSL